MRDAYEMQRGYVPVGQLSTQSRAEFITRTYNHLFGSIVLFTLIEFWLFSSGLYQPILKVMFSMPWFLILGLFMVTTWMARNAAANSPSQGVQYAALAGLVVSWSIMFVPMLYVANESVGGGVIQSAAAVTLVAFGGLTGIVFFTRKDFSFLRSGLMFGGVLALVAIGASLVFGAQLGTWFSVAMIGLCGMSILYDTSNVMLHYPEDRHVAAAAALFASVALMFWYVLRLFMSRD